MDTMMLGICKSMIEKSMGATINDITLQAINGEEYFVFDMANASGETVLKQVKINDLYPKIISSSIEPVNVPVGTIWVVTA